MLESRNARAEERMGTEEGEGECGEWEGRGRIGAGMVIWRGGIR